MPGRGLVRAWGLGFLLCAAIASANEPAEPETGGRLEVGAPAPPITAKAWLNTDGGASPVGEATDGKVVMLEFWGTWCGPCVRAMPHVQDLHDRYGRRGLVVLGITRESAEAVTDWVAERKITFPIGCDPEQTCVTSYRIQGWPSTYLVGKDGNLLFVGNPYSVEPAIEKALGLESGPGTLLTGYLDALAGKNAAAARESLERLTEKAPAAFDLKAWARAGLPEEPPEPATPPKVDAAKAIDAIVAASRAGDAAKRGASLTPVAQAGPSDFDLRSWARAALGKAHPLTKGELEADLAASRFGPALDALLFRNPPAAVLSAAAKHAGFVAWCKSKRTEVRADARRVLMAIRYVFVEKPMEGFDDALQKKFWSDMSVSGMSFSEDRKQIQGILVGGAMVPRDGAAGYVSDQLSRYALMTSVVDGKPLKASQVAAAAKKEENAIVEELKRTY